MDNSNEQERLIKVLADRRFNKIAVFTIMSKTKNWEADYIEELTGYASDYNHSADDVIDRLLEINRKRPRHASEHHFKKSENDSDGDKPFLYMCNSGGMVGVIKFEVRPTDADFFYFDLWDFNVCQLPKDIYDDDELERCAENWCHPTEWVVDKYKEMREIDYSRYTAVIVWNDMTPNSLMFLYTVCKFVKGCDIFENNVTKFDMSPVRGFGEPDKDFTGIYAGMRLITPELKERFVKIYDRYAGMPMCAKVADGYEIIEVEDDVIVNRILSHCSDEYQTAYKIAVETMECEGDDLQKTIGFGYYICKIYQLTIAGAFDVKQLKIPDHARQGSEPEMYNGVDVSTATCYSIKLKA